MDIMITIDGNNSYEVGGSYRRLVRIVDEATRMTTGYKLKLGMDDGENVISLRQHVGNSRRSLTCPGHIIL